MAKESGWNPTLLDLLMDKARLTFNDGYVLSGDPAGGSRGAIHTNLENEDPHIMRNRSYTLDVHGLEAALKAIMKDRKKRDREIR